MTNHEKKRDLIINGNIYKLILLISIPLMISELIQRTYTLSDIYFLGKLGTTEVGALSFVNPIINAIGAIGNALAVPILAIISQSIGRKDYEGAKKNIGNMIVLTTILSLILSIIGISTSKYILVLFKAKGDLLIEGNLYLRIALVGTFFTFINICYISIKQAMGDTMRPLLMNIVSLFLNLILNPIFIFKLGMGIEGAAISTVISKGVLGIYGLYDLLIKDNGLKVERRHFSLDKAEIKRVLTLGLPSIVTRIAPSLGNVVINSYAIGFSTVAVASLGLGNRINSIVFSLSSSLCASMTVLAGQNIGAGNIPRVRLAVRRLLALSLLISFIGCSVIIGFSDQILKVFTKDPLVIETTKRFFLFVTPTVFGWGIFQIVMGVYQGAGYPRITMYLSSSRLWLIRVPFIVIFTKIIGEDALWVSTSIATGIISIVCIIIYRSNTWTKKNKHMTNS